MWNDSFLCTSLFEKVFFLTLRALKTNRKLQCKEMVMITVMVILAKVLGSFVIWVICLIVLCCTLGCLNRRCCIPAPPTSFICWIFQPQHALPDVMVWMVCNNERIAYHRFQAKDLLFTKEKELQGKFCGKRQTVFLKVTPNKFSFSQSYFSEHWVLYIEPLSLLHVGGY